MDIFGFEALPPALFEYVNFLVKAVPIRSIPTFIELVFGAMLTQAGFVTQAWLAIKPLRHWTSYYKWLQHGKWSWVALGVQMALLVSTFFPQPFWFLVIDDTFICRSSKKAPGSSIQHQHGSKPNRPKYARGQCWVSLAMSICDGVRFVAVPLLSRLMRAKGNSSKLDAARLLLRMTAPVFVQKQVFVLMDSWYMRWVLIQYAFSLGYHVIGQVRKDTALYELPPERADKQKGRPRKYGKKYTSEIVADLPLHTGTFFLYGELRKVEYRSAVVVARFIKGRTVRTVWMRFEEKPGTWTKQRLLLSTKDSLTAEEVFKYYARRWPIEDLFNQMKNYWGWKDAWQQSRQVLHRWTQILSIGYALPQLLNISGGDQVANFANLTPWRLKRCMTAGRVRLGIQRILGQVRIRDWWNPKSRKFEAPEMTKGPPEPS